MKEKLLMLFTQCRNIKREKYNEHTSKLWSTIKDCFTICMAKLKKITIEEFVKYFLYIGFSIVAIWAIVYLYEVVMALGIIAALLYLMWKKNEQDEQDKLQQRKEAILLQEKKKRENEYKLSELNYKFNVPITKTINYSLNQYILVSEEKSLIMINERIYPFRDIINFSLSDNSIEIFSPTISKTKTNTGSMVGRAIVGGVLTGGAGAIIGGVTAGKTTETTGGTSHTKHNYTLLVTVNNLSNPIERIYLGEKIEFANELCSLFSVIISRKQMLQSSTEE